ncbi:S-adenosyl-l-methionine hydroxide adenosyltransferase family protein [Synechococcus sp. H55.9]|uniref:SAM hydrolase/SAM-dependent halogenase family protein n=1 Tax=unclassified Synechococcus TaxID=2626047 RepID=UPI0039C32FA9
MPFISLLTDFGLQDPYVGILKGVIWGIAPQAQLIDLSHGIPPQDVAAARFALMTAYPHLPSGTIHLAVVDPGVGSHRRAVAIQTQEGYLVGPDNGLFSGVLEQSPPLAAVELNRPRYWRTLSPSRTFHGRDIFAPVAAHLANGIPLLELGDPFDVAELTPWNWPQPQEEPNGWRGLIQAIDHFGNGITNLPGHWVEGRSWSAWIKGIPVRSAATFAEGRQGELLALVGSSGWVEIVQNGGNASRSLDFKVGDEVRLQWNG